MFEISCYILIIYSVSLKAKWVITVTWYAGVTIPILKPWNP